MGLMSNHRILLEASEALGSNLTASPSKECARPQLVTFAMLEILYNLY